MVVLGQVAHAGTLFSMTGGSGSEGTSSPTVCSGVADA